MFTKSRRPYADVLRRSQYARAGRVYIIFDLPEAGVSHWKGGVARRIILLRGRGLE